MRDRYLSRIFVHNEFRKTSPIFKTQVYRQNLKYGSA